MPKPKPAFTASTAFTAPTASSAFIYLASQSPRRRQLLTQIGAAHELLLPAEDEDAEAIERARAYRLAGADGFFMPGLKNLSVLRTLVECANLPINVMAGEEALDDYAQLGVARISFGPLTYFKAIAAVSGFAVDRA